MNGSKAGVVVRPKFYDGQIDLTQRRAWFDGEAELTETAETAEATTGLDWAAVSPTDIPADVIKQHPLYQSVLKESIERRQKLKALADEGEKPAKSEKKPETHTDEVPAWAQALVSTVEGLVKANTEAPLQAAKAAAISQYGFSDAQAAFLTGATVAEVEANAAKMAAAFSLPKASAGNAGTQSAADSLAARLKERVQQQVEPLNNPGIFDPGVQRQHQGGTIR